MLDRVIDYKILTDRSRKTSAMCREMLGSESDDEVPLRQTVMEGEYWAENDSLMEGKCHVMRAIEKNYSAERVIPGNCE